MESRRRTSSITDRSVTRTPSSPRSVEPDQAKPKTSRERDRHKNSYIPVLRGEKIDMGSYMRLQAKSSSASKIFRHDSDSPRIQRMDSDASKIQRLDLDSPRSQRHDSDTSKLIRIDSPSMRTEPFDSDTSKLLRIISDSQRTHRLDSDLPSIKRLDSDIARIQQLDSDIARLQDISSDSSKINRLDFLATIDEFDEKCKTLLEKEKIIAEYYTKIDEMIQRFMSEKEEHLGSTDDSWSSCAQEVLCNGKSLTDAILTNVEANLHQISDIWFSTTTNFSSILKCAKKEPVINETKLEMEDVKFNLAIKHAKSLSLMKSKCVIDEVRKLLKAREAIRTELENLLRFNLKCGVCGAFNIVQDRFDESVLKKSSKMGTGDSYKECSDDQGNTSGDSYVEDPKHSRKTKAYKSSKKVSTSLSEKCRSRGKGKEKAKREDTAVYNVEVLQPGDIPPDMKPDDLKDMQSWAEELNKKNDTITSLNTKIFRMQQTISEQSVRNNELQLKLSECDEKVQWNQVLWKQIGKMKEQIRGLQHSNKQLECQKKELLGRMARLDQEIERLIKMNEVLNKKKFLLGSEDVHRFDPDSTSRRSTAWERGSHEDKAIVEKHNAIDQLQTILTIMTDQKNLAQQQITLYQTKIEELEILLKNNKPL